MFISNLIAATTLLASATLAAPTVSPSFIFPTLDNYEAPPQTGRNDIGYTMGNPVLTGDVPVYLIYYGDWAEKSKVI